MAATRRLAAIMFTDMVGYTASTQTDEAAALRLLQEQEELVRPVLAGHQGREIKSTGDGFLVELDSALHAVQCAIDIHKRLHERNAKQGGQPIRLRIGVHLGDVEERGGDIFGDAVNIAARIEPLALPGGICISGGVFDQVRNKIPARFEKLQPRALKNVRFPTDVYRVELPWGEAEATGEPAPPTRLAVLPLANISPDPKDEYFADGLTEELISALSKLRELRIIARTSVGQYKSTAKSVSQIGAELGVASVLEGSVRKSGNRLRISLQLIDAVTQEPIWAESFDRELDDVFAVQTEIAERTAGALRVELLGPEQEAIHRRPTSDLAAYNLYLKGIHAVRQATYEGLTESIKFFRGAIRKDPEFSLPHSYLANTYIALAGDTLAPRVAFPRARELVGRALELDPNSSDAHTARGNLALQHEQDWAVAETEFRWAISINPSDANAHYWYAMLLWTVRRYEEALEQLRTAIELDPLWELPKIGLTTVHTLCGDLASAVASAEEERDRDPSNPAARIRLATVYARAGRRDDAAKEVERSTGVLSETDRWNRAVVRAALGRPEEARSLLAEWTAASSSRYVNPALIAGLHAALGEKEEALEGLERDTKAGGRSLWSEYQWSAFDPVRGDPRFGSLLQRLNLLRDAGGTSRIPA